MAKEICISTTPHETRLAIVEDDQLTEIYYERENEYTLAGSIYKGKVTRVLPGMQSAFVEVGLERDAFLYVTDFLEEQEEGADFEAAKPGGGARKERPEGGRAGGRRGERSGDGQRPAQAASSAAAVSGQESRGQESRGQEPRGSAIAEAGGDDGAETAAAGKGEEFQEGTRRWRGRRGRRRGVRGAREAGGQEQSPAASNESAEDGEGVEGHGYSFDRDEESAGGSISIEAEAEPVRERSAESGRRNEGQRGGRRSEHGSSDRGSSERGASDRGSSRDRQQETITLPGEALQKYGQQPVVAEGKEGAAPARDESRPRPPQVTSRPSTLVEQPIAWDGVSAALPGETLSRHRESAATPVAAPIAEPVQIPVEMELHPTSSENATIDTVFPPAHAEPSALAEEPASEAAGHAPLVREEEEATHTEAAEESATDQPEYDPERASASHRVDPSAPREFRLSSLFGRDAEPSEKAAEAGSPEAEQTHRTDAPDAASTAEAEQHPTMPPQTTFANGGVVHQDHPHEAQPLEQTSPEQHSHEAAALDHLHAFTPGDGQVEEEVIDEEEYDFAPLPEHAGAHDDEHDLGDLVEEETQVTGGSEIGDVIRDQQIDRQVTSSDDDDFEDSDEEPAEDEEEDESQPATAAVAGEEGAPAPRRTGRNDRQRGRGDRRGRSGRNGRRQSAQTSDLPIISELLKQGQEILVQIAKEPIAKKGARITSHIALPGRFLVFMPTVNHVGVSRKIWSDEERTRLKRILISEKGEASGGFIVRTAAENATEEELRADLRFLISLWAEIKQRSDAAKAPALIYHDLNLIERILRDQVSDNFSTIWVDSEAEYERIVRFLNRFQPSLVRRVKLYTKETPLFEQFGIQEEISKALKSKVWLKSGGSIVINQTEALVAIDINTGKYVGKTARLEDTILKTNLDSIPEIVRQIRLRDLGGIIVIDFIDMDERKNRNKVMQALEEELKLDRAPSKVLQFNDFGLVAITRKRVKQSLERTLSVQCNICAGTGMVKSPTTVANEIYTEMRKMQKHFERHDVMLRVHPEVVKTLKSTNGRWLNELEEMTGRTIIVKSDPALHPEQFDIH